MARYRYPLLWSTAVALSCSAPPEPGTLSAGDLADSQGTGTSSSSSASASTDGYVATSSGTTGHTSAAASTGGTLLHDVGSDHDLGSSTPAGCDGKIDFLFVLARHSLMKDVQDKLTEAFPAFIDTIEAEFEDFDYHIMVVDGDEHWGSKVCNAECTPEGCALIEDYPCALLDTVTECDATLGAGTVFPAGFYATNAPCPVSDGRRYMTMGQKDLKETFACVAQVGTSGDDRVGEALVAAMSPELNDDDGCNAGFLRDDALLMVTMIGDYDYDSAGTPEEWAEAIRDAKGGDADAVVMLSVTDPKCPPYDRLCRLAEMFPYHMIGHVVDDDYGLLFSHATELVGEACDAFIPR